MVFEKLLEHKRPALLLIGAAAGFAALAGCDSPTVAENRPAVVEEHVDHPAYTSFILVGKVFVPIFHPETFGLKVKQCGEAGEQNADEHGCVEQELGVDKKVYDRIHDGDTVVPQVVTEATE
ncbi:MAG TPA: hypothetical protein VLF40_03095 [Candidatus Saccharimonadales bacterium]|nr:hypothetical protein [Candidatus Saccharimonadales bacterium]